MRTFAQGVADELISQHGRKARERALALASATARHGSGVECAAFFGLVAELIDHILPEEPALGA